MTDRFFRIESQHSLPTTMEDPDPPSRPPSAQQPLPSSPQVQKLRAECTLKSGQSFSAAQCLGTILNIIHTIDPTARLVSKTQTTTFTRTSEIPTDSEEFHQHFDVNQHKLRYKRIFHLVFKVNSVTTLQEWKSTTNFDTALKTADIWLYHHPFNTSDVRPVGIFTHVSPTLTYRKQFRHQLSMVLCQHLQDQTSISPPSMNDITDDSHAQNDGQTAHQKHIDRSSIDLPVFEVVKTTITVRSTINDQDIHHIPVLELRSDSNQVRRLCQLIMMANLEQPCFGIFLPTFFRYEEPQVYYNQLADHHQHLRNLRPIVIYGFHDTVMNRPFPTSSSSSSESFYQHIIQLKGPNDGTSLFPHIALTQQTASNGKWMLVTTADNYQHARTYIDEILPQEYALLVTETERSQWKPTFLNGPYRLRRPTQSSRDYAEKLRSALSTSTTTSNHEGPQSPHRMNTTSNFVPSESRLKNSTKKTYASVVSRNSTPTVHPPINPDTHHLQTALQEFTNQICELTTQLTEILQRTTNHQLQLEKVHQALEKQHSQIQHIHNCIDQPPSDTPINLSYSPPSKTSPQKQITKNTYPRAITADSGSSPNSQTSRKEATSNQQYTQPSYSHNNQDETVDYSIAMSLAHEKEKD